MARACKQSDGRQVGGINKWKCFNCQKSFDNKQRWWNHLWSIF